MKSRLERYRWKVENVLREQHFVVGKRERGLIGERTANGRRYFYMVADRREGKRIVERFIKIPENNTKKLLLPFRRQIEVAKYLKQKRIINTRGVIAYNCDPKRGTPFAVMETFPTGHAKIGFIEDNQGVERLGRREAERIIIQLKRFHDVSVRMLPSGLKKVLKKNPGNYDSFRREILRNLSKKVRPLDHRKSSEPLYRVFERRLEINDLKEKTKELLNDCGPIIDTNANRKISLVHGDMAPNNLYIFDSGDVEFLDLEWVGTFKNSAIAIIIDYGNLRARSWKNSKFRKLLDEALIRAYRKEGKEVLGKAIVRLSILRSHMLLSGFFENYDYPKQKKPVQSRRRKETERDIAEAFSLLSQSKVA